MNLFHITGKNVKESDNYVSNNIMYHINFYKNIRTFTKITVQIDSSTSGAVLRSLPPEKSANRFIQITDPRKEIPHALSCK